MGTRGPKPLPEKVLSMRGSSMPSRRKRAPVPRVTLPEDRPPPLPRGLSAAARKWAKALYARGIYSASEHKLIIEALRLHDYMQSMHATLAAEGLTFTDDKGQVRMRPEIAALKDCRLALLKYCKALHIEEP